MSRPPLFAITALVLGLCAGCASPFDRDRSAEPSDVPRLELSEPATPLAAGDQPAAATTVPGAPGATTTTARSTNTTGAGVAVSTAPPRAGEAPPSAPRQLATATDPSSDAGLGARGYGDLVAVTIEETGDQLRATIDLAAAVPTALAEGEVEGIGLDIYRSSDDESDFQLFADGGADGWRAYLQTPEGFVQYPGEFALGGNRLVFTVPWSAIGGRNSFRASVFADWSAKGTVLNQSGSDRAPDRDTLVVATRAAS